MVIEKRHIVFICSTCAVENVKSIVARCYNAVVNCKLIIHWCYGSP